MGWYLTIDKAKERNDKFENLRTGNFNNKLTHKYCSNEFCRQSKSQIPGHPATGNVQSRLFRGELLMSIFTRRIKKVNRRSFWYETHLRTIKKAVKTVWWWQLKYNNKIKYWQFFSKILAMKF